MSLSAGDSKGNKLNAEMEEELHDLRTEKKILEYIKPLHDGQNNIMIMLQSIENKVVIHNNYEKRIRQLEVNQWKITGIYTGVLAIISIILFLIK